MIVSLLLLFAVSSYAQKLAIKTNALYLTTATPNIGMEIGLSSKLTLDITYGINPFTFEDNLKWKHWVVQPELRYWFCESFYGHFVGLHAGAGEYNISKVAIPTVDNAKDYRYEGMAVLGGLAYGYSWVLSGRWNIEASFGVGIVHTKYRQFDCPLCGKHLGDKIETFVAPTKAAVSVIYLIK